MDGAKVNPSGLNGLENQMEPSMPSLSIQKREGELEKKNRRGQGFLAADHLEEEKKKREVLSIPS